MSSANLQETARKDDLSTITDVVKQGFTNQEVRVEAEMQSAGVLWIKLRAAQSLDAQNSLNIVAESLNNIKPHEITSVRISRVSSKNHTQPIWDRYLALKQGKFIDDMKIVNPTVNRPHKVNPVMAAICGLAAFGLLLSVFTRKPAATAISSSTSVSPPATSTASRTFLGRSQTGYELWTDKNCVYVKGITEADLARLNTNVWGFKDAVKKETGSTCVLFE